MTDFHKAVGECVAGVFIARRNLDWAMLAESSGRLQGLQEAAANEDQLSSVDHGLALICNVQADWWLSLQEYSQALLLVAEGWRILDAKDARRERLCLPALAGTEARWRLLGTLAEIKWRGDGEWRDDILPVEEMHDCWVQAEAGFADYIKRKLGAAANRRCWNESADDRYLNNVRELMDSGIALAACCQRHMPSGVRHVISLCNRWHRVAFGGYGIAEAVGHWRKEIGMLPETPWYWQYELNKHLLARDDASAGRDAHLSEDEAVELLDRTRSALLREGRIHGTAEQAVDADLRPLRSRLMAPFASRRSVLEVVRRAS